MKSLSIIFLCILLLFLHTSISKSVADDNTDIKQTIEQLFEGVRNRDTTLMYNAFHHTARVQTTFVNKKKQPIIVTQTIQEFVRDARRSSKNFYDLRVNSYDIKLEENLASVWTTYSFYIGTKLDHCGVNAFQLFKSPKGWKIVQLSDTRRKEGCKK